MIAAARKSWKLAIGYVVLTASLYVMRPRDATNMKRIGYAAYVTRGEAIAPCKNALGRAVAGLILSAACAIPLLAAAPAEPYLVTQKGQQFNPNELTIHRGDKVGIVNDDGELIHHAYVDSPSFSFDSGDQEPGKQDGYRVLRAG